MKIKLILAIIVCILMGGMIGYSLQKTPIIINSTPTSCPIIKPTSCPDNKPIATTITTIPPTTTTIPYDSFNDCYIINQIRYCHNIPTITLPRIETIPFISGTDALNDKKNIDYEKTCNTNTDCKWSRTFSSCICNINKNGQIYDVTIERHKNYDQPEFKINITQLAQGRYFVNLSTSFNDTFGVKQTKGIMWTLREIDYINTTNYPNMNIYLKYWNGSIKKIR